MSSRKLFSALRWESKRDTELQPDLTQSRPQESEQDDKWSFCLTAGTLCQRIRRDDEQTTAPEPYTGLQGESGAGRHQGRSNAWPTGGAFRRSPQSDYDMESATRR